MSYLVSLRSRESARVDLERTSACYIVFPYVSNQTPATLKVSQPTSRSDSKYLLCRFDDVPIGPYETAIDEELPKASNQMEEGPSMEFHQTVRSEHWLRPFRSLGTSCGFPTRSPKHM